MSKKVSDTIDWSVFNGDPEDTCRCKCGRVFRSHAKYLGSISRHVSRRPCPGCGSHLEVKGISSDPEKFTIGR